MTATRDTQDMVATETRQKVWIKWQLYLSLFGLLLGLLMGLLQALERADISLYDQVLLASYFQGLTLHGVALAIVFTFMFANSFLSLTTMRGLDRPLRSTAMVQGVFWLATVGVALAAIAILTNKATVLFTFYAPLQATPIFYLGAVLLVVSTWVTSANMFLTLRDWKRDNPGEPIPLLAHISVVTFIMWDIASIGIAVETVAFIIPWSFGWIDGTDPLLNRTLFWFSGHPIVYFWLLPVYVSWYMMIPKQVSGKLFSASIVKGVFILFLLLSIPVGLHHQFTDPGVDDGLKLVHGVLTFAVFFPSMITAFTLFHALEIGGRKRGGTGLLKWILKLPWGDPSVVAQLLAMMAFALGGASGLVNASASVNTVVHNTAFIPGHFHLTVGTAVALSIMGVSYWLVPYLTGKPMIGRKLALAQAWTWFIGVLLFSRGQMAAGIEGQPRRYWASESPFAESSWEFWSYFTAIGGVIMFISGVLFFTVLYLTLRQPAGSGETIQMPVAETIHPNSAGAPILDRLGLWVVATVVLILLAYVPVFLSHSFDFSSPGFRLY